MFSPLANEGYRRLFMAQVAALLGTGLATVALGLLAHDIAGAGAGEILGIALAIKMVAYVTVAPFAAALAQNIPRKTLLVTLDLVRALVAGSLPFVSEAWHVYGLMTILYIASAAFTPAFQSMIPEVLPDEREYTKALSLSRLASDLESVASPVIAALLLSVISYNNLFAGTAVGFAASALLVVAATLPAIRPVHAKPFLQRLTTGFRIYLHTPRLRGLLVVGFATAAGGAMAFVNTVTIVQTDLRLDPQATAWALAAFGAGSILAALLLSPLLDSVSERFAMIAGGGVITLVLVVGALRPAGYVELLGMWFGLGMGYSLTLTPVGRVLRRSSSSEDRPALFAANFTLSHLCWLAAYPLAGFASAFADVRFAFLALAAVSAVSTALALLLWPARDPCTVRHTHADLPPGHPHLAEHGAEHEHPVTIDQWHARWPAEQD